MTPAERSRLEALVERMRRESRELDDCHDNEPGASLRYWANELAAELAGAEEETDDLHLAALLNASPAPVKASRAVADGAAACDCCDGRGEVGGLLPDGGGYQTDPCPYCDGTGIQPAPPLLDPTVVAELERLVDVSASPLNIGDYVCGNWPAILAALRQGTAPATVTDAMVEAAGTAFARYCGGYDSSMRAAILAALQAQRGE